MKKIYQFPSLTSTRFLSVEEKQPSSDEVTLRIQCEGDEFALPFSVAEFNELCSLRYRLEFAVVGAA
jgi:hypothetical protein